MLKSVSYAGLEPGPKLLVLGAVHGNEKCGTAAIHKILGEIDSGKIKVLRGQAVFVPIANPRAHEKDARFTERNLNRYLVPTPNPDSYEARLGNALCPLLEACDVLLDIHSYTVGGAPFIFVSSHDEKEHAFAASLGPYALLTGWAEAYAKTGRKAREEDSEESTGTTEYARRFGAMAATIECGQHKDPAAPEIAYEAIRNALRYLEMTDEPKAAGAPGKAKLVTVTHVFYRDNEGKFPKAWKHLEPVKPGEVLALHADGSAIEAPANGFIIMPKESCPIGEEWFYFGVEKAA